jgi:hypothetical protein
MRNRVLSLVLFIVVGFGADKLLAQEGEMYPLLAGETLEDKIVELPADVKGKYAVIGMAYSKKATDDFNTWVSPVYNKFIAKTGMLDKLYDVHVYFVPMFTGVKKAGKEKAMEQMEENGDKEAFPYVIFYEGDLDVYAEELGLDDKKVPYVFLLDASGKVVYSTSGAYTEDKMLAMEKIILGE